MNAPLVVKLGSALVTNRGRPNQPLLRDIARQLRQAQPVCVVSSGAIALGVARSGLQRRPRRLPTLQAVSALGQADLQRAWSEAFAEQGIAAAQILLTSQEIAERRSYVNVRNTLRELLRLGAIPVLNENDATATDEISFGDNDVLAAQVAVLLRARQLVLLTSVEGVLGNDGVIPDGENVVSEELGPPSPVGSGGMPSKVASARLAAAGGVPTVITSPAHLTPALTNDHVGTRFAAKPTCESAYKLWLRYGIRPLAEVMVDAGAEDALARRKSSLLAVGVLSWSRDFRVGDGIAIANSAGHVIAHGISSIEANDLAAPPAALEVVHRDHLVLL